MSAQLPRSRSECTIKVKLPNSIHVQGGSNKGNCGLSVSSPELRSMLIYLNTTVPQNLRPETLSSSHKPRSRVRRRLTTDIRQAVSCTMSSCCGVRVFLIILQILLGALITGLSAYVHIIIPAIRMREKPLWAGVPLLLAGLSSVFFCVKGKKDEEVSLSLVVVKTACSILSAISIFLCVTAAVFCGIHIGHLFSYAYCEHVDNGCLCHHSQDQSARTFLYSPVEDCHFVYLHVKIFIIASGSLCVVGSLVAFSFVIHIWKSRYGNIAGGV
ncbi:sarcospan [Biomphalaria pfeifferi]|uniref:Sarcospan n=1 Tax=Biomphalaria pfeifferi TaxID=112525 RepID=A0AAD8CAJ7_BIOPF|nr:sarcospan [Biomphalaria pfeifferi]